MMFRGLFVVFSVLICSVGSIQAAQFSADPEVRLVGPRTAILLNPLSFIDGEGREWRVPRNYKSNGASIPQPLWSFFGGPFSGHYQNASIVHDYFCERRSIESEMVHSMFREAMLTSGVSNRKATVMYMAVKWFGPNWERDDTQVPPECVAGPMFNPTRCVLNADPQTTDVTRELTEEAFNDFLSELRSEGFDEEAEELQQEVTF